MLKHCIVALVVIGTTNSVFSQLKEDKKTKLKLFIDCSNVWCDQTFIRSEINIVDFVFDRIAADVHFLVTSTPVGNGGDKYQLIFYGQRKFAGQKDTLRFTMPPVYTEVEVREKILTHLKIGLLPYVAKTDMINYVTMDFKRHDTDAYTAKEEKDKWNYWVFRLSSDGSLEIDQNYLSTYLNGNITANRTTEKLRVEFLLSTGKNISKFKYEDEEGEEQSFTVINTNYRFTNTTVFAISDHWSYGYYLYLRNNTFSNFQNSIQATPALEYNIFPYKEVNNKFLTLSYGIDVIHNNYYEVTIYNKLSENLYGHSARIVSRFNQKWGTLNYTINYSNYFHNWNFYSLEVNAEAEVRINGSLSFYVYAFGGLTRNQVFIPKGSASVEDVLARRRQLASGYNFGAWFGLSYRFGSILNNFVNPRFSQY